MKKDGSVAHTVGHAYSLTALSATGGLSKNGVTAPTVAMPRRKRKHSIFASYNSREIGLDVGLRYVYEGNVPGEGGENTYCYQCGELLIRRYGFQILENKIRDSRCPRCGAKIDGML